MSTLKATNLQHASSASPNIVLDSSGNATMAGSMAMATPFAMRNKIINGAMEIDQRYSGAAVANSAGYNVDRWGDALSGSGRYTAQRVTTAPAGFINSLSHTVTTAVSPGSGDIYQIYQIIEGYNIADFAFGTASAKAITLSFWVRSSIAGTYAVSLCNNGASRALVATYAISSANTWEYKTIPLPGDTTGTWLVDNGVGLALRFDLGSGSGYDTTTTGSWQATDKRRTSSCVNWISTNGATFYLTGVQLEVGSVATPFERRLFPQELAMCQRYYFKCNVTVIVAVNYQYWPLAVPMRVSPTLQVVAGSVYSAALGGVPFSEANSYNAIRQVTGATSASDALIACNAEL